MRPSFFNNPSFQNLLCTLSCHKPLIGDQLTDSVTLASVQTLVVLSVGISRHNTDANFSTGTFYALIIGINEYASPSVSNLSGAVPDALAIKNYLEQRLRVPKSQIRLLRNAEATRGAIIQEFNNLVADPRIRRGDPILIFYAGHGGEVKAPVGWESGDGKIQMLIPHDFRTTVGGLEVKGIPDRTIGTLLSRVAEKWDDNIVCLAEMDKDVYATDQVMCTDCYLRLLSLWVWHARCFSRI